MGLSGVCSRPRSNCTRSEIIAATPLLRSSYFEDRELHGVSQSFTDIFFRSKFSLKNADQSLKLGWFTTFNIGNDMYVFFCDIHWNKWFLHTQELSDTYKKSSSVSLSLINHRVFKLKRTLIDVTTNLSAIKFYSFSLIYNVKNVICESIL